MKEKKYFDEFVLPYINQKEETQEVKLNLFSERKIKMVPLSIRMPQSFSIMDDEMSEIKYPYGERPLEIYTNEDMDINVTFHREIYTMTDSQEVRDESLEMLQKEVAGVIVSAKGEIDSAIGTIAYFEMITKASDMNIYCNMFFMKYGSEVIIGSFNCPESVKKEWENEVRKMIGSIDYINQKEIV